jgi:hypothetical protein
MAARGAVWGLGAESDAGEWWGVRIKRAGSILFSVRSRHDAMSHRPRIHLDGVPLHIVQRGHKRETCFLAEEDYYTYLHWLKQALAEADCGLHAYALMT